jgi:hypothetical protein
VIARPFTAGRRSVWACYGSVAVGALLLAPTVGLVVVALTLIGYGIWDLWHLRRHRDLVSPSLAEACVALDVPLGFAVLIAVPGLTIGHSAGRGASRAARFGRRHAACCRPPVGTTRTGHGATWSKRKVKLPRKTDATGP